MERKIRYTPGKSGEDLRKGMSHLKVFKRMTREDIKLQLARKFLIQTIQMMGKYGGMILENIQY